MSSYGKKWSAWDEQSEAGGKRVNAALHGVQVRSGVGAVDTMTPLDVVCALEEGVELVEESDYDEGYAAGVLAGRSEGMVSALNFIFKDGYHPGVVMRRAYGLAQKLRPALIACMSMADLGSMFGETRAAWQARMKMLFKGVNIRSRSEKRVGAKSRMAEAQRGNKNRVNGAKRDRQVSSE